MLIARLIAGLDGLEIRLDNTRQALGRHGIEIASCAQLDANPEVLEIRVASPDRPAFMQVLERHLEPHAMLVSEREITIPNVFVSDMDSTMIGQECIDELADFAGLKDKIADITERAMQGELDFEDALRERVGLLAGLDESAIQKCLDQRIRATPGAKTLVATLRAHGCRTVLVTGGFHHFADVVTEQLGFERVVGNRLEVNGGRLTGGLEGVICTSATKQAVLEEEIAKVGKGAVAMATGDGANDIPMIVAADYGFAYCAKAKAREAANGRVDSPDLSVILSLLGIGEANWIVT